MQTWEKDGCGTSTKWLNRVIDDFKQDGGAKDIKSAELLKQYLNRLNNEALIELCEIDRETTLQMLVDCFGAADGFDKYAAVFLTQRILTEKWIEKDRYNKLYNRMTEQIKQTEEKYQSEIISLKAQLYDVFTGNYEITIKENKKT